ncbi:cytochrome c [Psychromarinibacter sp. C21-152]|uniref:Cytochrome c n=1 Tax=Psychromarinibacter sediminicola TaxID=3033385 RepID=A0AAE3NVA9_9RHOB|nr:cytochrome c [Psychromarinibacter sediminicola]MDF0602771.1 cytochrome c [Psychromarinibacter sediminicola]
MTKLLTAALALVIVTDATAYLLQERGFDAPRNASAPATAATLAAGERAFEANCAACHGAQAGGTDKGPPLVHRIYEPSHHADYAFRMAVRNGVRQHHWKFGDMPPVEGMTDEEVTRITAHVRALQQEAGIE